MSTTGLSPDREASLRELEAQLLLLESLKASRDRSVPPLARVAREGPLPLSFAQERLWLIDQLIPNSPLYNIPSAVRLAGPLDTAVLERCLAEIVRRHEVLRTALRPAEGGVVQAVGDPGPFPLPLADLQEVRAAERDAEVHRLAREEAERPFDLQTGPLVRAALLRLEPGQHVLLLTLHHIVSDGWSAGILLRELAALYGTFRQGLPSPLPELPVQYADYACWQRRWLSGEVLERELAYWRQRLAGLPARLEMPTDHPYPAVQTFRGDSRSTAVGEELAAGLRTLAREAGATLFMVFLAAFQALLARWSRQEDFGLGTPVAGRGRAGVEGLIGFFVNTVVLRADLAGDPTFRELLDRVRGATLEAFDHQELPFERLVEGLAPERNLAHSPLFQVMFLFDEAPPASHEVSGMTLSPLIVPDGTAKFDLTFGLAPAGEGQTATLRFNRDLFEVTTAQRLLSHFDRLLAGVAAAPDQRLSAVSLLSEEQRHQLLIGWNDTGIDLERVPLVHRQIEEQARRTPEATAAVFGGERLSYRELDQRSCLLAHVLGRLGVGPEVLVGIAMERSLEMLVGVLAVLRAGGAYVPLDPAYPRERLAFMLEDSQVAVLLTQERLLDRLPESTAHVVVVDRDETVLAAEASQPAGAPWSGVGLENAAYVIYTSGSTGTPKGVVIRHGGVAALVSWASQAYSRERLAGVLGSTSICFDLSAFELFTPLATGGAVVLAEDALALPDLPAASEVTLINTVPSAMTELVRAGAVPASVRTVILAGEPLRRELVTQIYQLTAVREVYNLYGPSEDSTYSTGLLVEPGGERGPSIGRPLAKARAYVLDGRLWPAPLGVPGELWLGGEGLARGYLGRPELTAERFRPDPFGAQGGDRLYRTGDLVRHLQGGEIDFLGRIDHQVKVRGFRIELGEIEAALLALDGVREAVVLVREDGPGGLTLAAYVALEPGAVLGAGELLGLLGRKLPYYMVPARFVFLEALPLTPNGKVDRKALERRRLDREQEPGDGSMAPRTWVQELLLGVFAEVLGVARVGLEDSFFNLGGHSLLATQVVSRLRRTLGVELPLRALFETPTVAGLAARVEAALRMGGPPASAIERVSRDGELPLSFAQQRLWFVDQLEPGSPVYNISTALRLSGDLSLAALAASLDEIVRRHEVLRTRFETATGKPSQVIDAQTPVALPVVDLAGLPRAEAEMLRLVAAAALLPFDLSRGPLLRVTVLRFGAQDHAVLLSLHHIVSDGWSMGALVRELSLLYTAFLDGRPSPLSELPIQYVDFAAWQRRWLSGETLEDQLRYWRGQLAGATTLLDLPTDRPRSAVPSPWGEKRPVALPAPLLEDLRRLCRGEGVTLFMALLAAFQAVLADSAGQQDFTLGTPVAGRGRLETEGLIGLFVNTLVLRADLAGDPDWRELLSRVRETALSAYAHQDLPFERLVDELQPERSLHHTPLFQVMLVLQNLPRAAFELPGLVVSPMAELGNEGRTVKFDLTLFVEEGEDLAAALMFRSGLFDGATAARMAEHLAILLEAAVADPSRRLSTLPRMRDAESQQLLREWNDTAVAAPLARCVHERFEEQVERRPDSAAVVFEGEALTYAELDSRANRLAHRLRRLEVGPEIPVGICIDRSLDLMVGLLAILKAGGAYLPLDLELPGERLSFMMADAGAPVLLTQTPRAPARPRHGARVVCMDVEEPATEPAGRPAGGAGPENLVYVIYTSGSTGRPKGVAVEHRQLASYLHGALERMALPAGASFATVSTIAADLGNTVVFASLCTGGTLHVLSPARLIDPEGTAEYFARHTIDCLKIVPSHLAALLTASRPDRCLPRRLLVLGGEPSHWDLVDGVRASGCRVLNHYGPTETTVGVATHEVGADMALRHAATVPLGRPLPGTRIHLLDPHLLPVAIGVAGEVCVGGGNVTRGYLGQPALTAAKFLPDPFSPSPGGRLYRTGDRARHLRDGSLEFLGRLDHQVKVRGFRVEPGEVESVLRSHPGVREAVVTALPSPAGGKRLVAYLVPGPGVAITVGELRSFLAPVLPEPMIPSTLVLLDALPLTPNGKVDRRALPEPEGPLDHAAAFVPPSTRIEEALAGIWAEVLGIERIGVRDNFFALGGDSILSIQIVSRAHQAGLGLTPKQIFQHQTIAELAAIVGVPGGQAEQGPVVGTLPLTPSQRRFFEAEPADPHHCNQSLMLAVEGALDERWLERAVSEVLAHHDALRLRFLRELESWRAVNSPPGGTAPCHRVDLSALPGATREAALTIAAAQAQGSLDLTRGPLLRAISFDLGAAMGGRLLLVLHQLAADQASGRILASDLESVYHQRSRGEEAHLPAKTTSFKRWAERLDELARSGELQTELEHWLAPPRQWMTPLPLDGGLDGNTVGSCRTLSVSLPAEETLTLMRDVLPSSRARLQEVLLTALALAFGRWRGDSALLIDLQAQGREEIDGLDLSRTVGGFAALFPAWIDPGPGGSPAVALARVKDQLRAVPGGGLGYGILRYGGGEPGEAARLRTLSQPQVAFNDLGSSGAGAPGPSLWQPAPERIGPLRSPRARREHLLEITACVDERLSVDFLYSGAVHDRATIEALATWFLEALRELIAQCKEPGGMAVAVSDFPLLDLGRNELEEALGEVQFEGFGD